MNCKVSIVMGIHNCESTLAESIDSIISQSFEDWELVMCDDGSSDSTLMVAKNYQKLYPKRIILLENEKNIGLSKTLNKCIENSRGEYIARMDGDDISCPNRLKKEVEFLDDNTEYSFVSTRTTIFDENGILGSASVIENPTVNDLIFNSTCFCHAACMIRREALLDVGCYSTDDVFRRYEDCNLWHKLYGKGYKGHNINESLYLIREGKTAYKKRGFKARKNGAYVRYVGFKLMGIPSKYFYVIIYQLFRDFVLGFMPIPIYKFFHKKKLENNK